MNPLVQPLLTKSSDGRWIIKLDASAIKDSACPRKIYWNSICGLQLKGWGRSVTMPYGTAIHKALELNYSLRPVKLCIEKAIEYYTPYNDRIISDKEFRTLPHLVLNLKEYFKQNPQSSDGLKAIQIGVDENGVETYSVEQKFEFPVYQTGKTIVVLCGTIDINGLYYGERCVVDHKTSSLAFAKKDEYFEQYEMDIQPQLYVWVDNHLTKRNYYLPFVVNGIFVKKQTEKGMKEGIFDGVNFSRSKIISYTADQMEAFERYLKRKLRDIVDWFECEVIESLEERSFCKSPYGLCKYFPICKSNKDLQPDIINAGYEQIVYNPLKFQE